MTKKEIKEIKKDFLEICNKSSETVYEADVKQLFKKWTSRGATNKEIQKMLKKLTKAYKKKSDQHDNLIQEKSHQGIELHSEIDWLLGEFYVIMLLYGCPKMIKSSDFNHSTDDKTGTYYKNGVSMHVKALATALENEQQIESDDEHTSPYPSFHFFNKIKNRYRKVKLYTKTLKIPVARDLDTYMFRKIRENKKLNLSGVIRKQSIGLDYLIKFDKRLNIFYSKTLDVTQFLRLEITIDSLEERINSKEFDKYDREYKSNVRYIRTAAKTWREELIKEMVSFSNANKYRSIKEYEILKDYKHKTLVVEAFGSIKELPTIDEVKSYMQYLKWLDKRKKIKNEYEFYKIYYVRK